MLNKTTAYAIRFLIYLAKLDVEGKASISEVSDATGTPLRFTAKLLQELAKKSVISSQKGPNGGFYLTSHQKNTDIFSIVSTINKDEFLKGCLLGLPECSEEKPCPIHERYRPIKELLVRLFKETTVATLSVNLIENLTFLRN